MKVLSDAILLLSEYLRQPFVIRALIVGLLVALCASLLGVVLVLKRYSFIGDGLSHVAFGAMAAASVLQLTNQNLLIMPVTVLTAVFLLTWSKKMRLNGDAAIAMFSVGALAIGYLLMNRFKTGPNVSGDVCSTLFGSTSILTLQTSDVVFCLITALVVIVSFFLAYHLIFAVTFDEVFAKSSGLKTGFLNLFIAVIISIIVVMGMNLVGSLLISALIIFPALSGMRIIGNFRGVVIFSAISSSVCAVMGILLSILLETPVGATIVAVNLVLFVICVLLGAVFRKG